MNSTSRSASEKKGGNNAEPGSQDAIERHQIEDEIRGYKAHQHDPKQIEREPSQLASPTQVVRWRAYRIDLSSGRIVQEGCGDHCAQPGFKENVAEGAIFGNADADLLHQPRRKEPERRPPPLAGTCQGVAAREN